MYQQLCGYKVEDKLYLGVREQKRLNTTAQVSGHFPLLGSNIHPSTLLSTIAAEWLALRVRKVPGSILGHKTAYINWRCSLFPSVLTGHGRFFHIPSKLLSINHRVMRRYIIWGTESVIK
jgi:hypothetical protein